MHTDRSGSVPNDISGFEFINIDESENHKCGINLQQRPRMGNSHVESFAELTATVYPPDPQYDISEKPWLPGPQKAYLLTNAKIVDPRAGVVRPNMTLQLAGGKIIRISLTTARDISSAVYYAGQKVEKIDASNYFVCPGLIDCE